MDARLQLLAERDRVIVGAEPQPAPAPARDPLATTAHVLTIGAALLTLQRLLRAER